MIKIENLTKRFGDLTVLDNVNFEAKKGECISIIGPSGTGKSVFLYCMNGLERYDSGKVFINGVDLHGKSTDIDLVRRKMGMVYQNFNLFSHLDVLENIVLAPVKVKRIPRAQAVEKAMKLLELVSLVDKIHSYPDELSGGQKQRIAIVRAMAMEPEIVLFDEPTSALDPSMAGEVLAVIRAFVKQGYTMIIVTHEMSFAKEISDRVLYMDEKGIYESGTPEEIFNSPQKPRTAAFIKKLKTFNYKVDSFNFDLVGMCAGLELFCAKYNIERKKINNINLAMEELIIYFLQKCYEKTRPPCIDITLGYREADKTIEVEIVHDGKSVNPFEKISYNADEKGDDTDDMGLFIVKKISAGVEFKNENGLNRHLIKI